nr:pleiotropic drug resistance protein 1-like [Tanacetum cinerariifolium]
SLSSAEAEFRGIAKGPAEALWIRKLVSEIGFPPRGSTQIISMLVELSRRERNANIKPDPDLDIFMKAASTIGQEESVVTYYTQGLIA